jgi:predicted  nucleic acid-binding Zn-ribbon protein
MSSPLTALLDLQAHDTAADQQRHRRATLPERTELAELERMLAAIDADAAAVGEARDELARRQKRLEDEAASLAAKAAAEDKRLYSGTVTAVKELQAIQDEITSLQRRQAAIEDDVLELMVELEPLDGQLAGFAKRRGEVGGKADDVRARLAAAEADLDAELARLDAERADIAAGLPAALLGEYDQLRKRLGGVAVAKLEAGSCRGCHLHLSAVELDRIRKLPADAVVHCEECGRILVH